MKNNAPKKKQTRQVLNLRLVIGTIIALVVLVPTVYLWHSYQIRRLGGAMLERADELEDRGQWAKAADYLNQYLKIHPERDDVRVRLAQAFDRSADDPQLKRRAIELYYRAVGLAPQRVDLRVRLAQLLLEAKRFTSAQDQADELLRIEPRNLDGLKVRALAKYQQSRKTGTVPLDETLPELEQALAEQPGDIELVEAFANSVRELSTDANPHAFNDKADSAMDRMVSAQPDNALVYLSRYRYRFRYGLDNATADLDKALQLAPSQPGVLLTAAVSATRKNSPVEAERFFQRVIEIAPSSVDAYLGLGDSLLARGEREKAIELWKRGLSTIGVNNILLNLRLAEAQIQSQRLDEGRKILRVLNAAMVNLRKRPGAQNNVASLQSAIDLLQAKWHYAKKNTVDAIALAKRVALSGHAGNEAGIDSVRLHAWLLVGAIYAEQNQWDSAATAYEHVVSLGPALVIGRMAAIQACASAGRLDAAIRHCEQTIQLAEVPKEAWLWLARLRFQQQLRRPLGQRDWPSTRQALSQAENALPKAWQVQLLKADLNVESGRENSRQQSIEILREAERSHPNSPAFWLQLVLAYERMGQPDEAERAIAHLKSLRDGKIDAEMLEANALARRGELEQARRLLRDAASAANVQRRRIVLEALIRLERRNGNLEHAEKILVELVEADPTDFILLRHLTELSLEAAKLADAQRWENQLRTSDPDSSYWRFYRAQRLIQESASRDDPKLSEAVKLHAQIAGQRPNWPAVEVLGALVAERQGRVGDAILAYHAAVRLGCRQASVFERAVALLLSRGRNAESQELLETLVQISEAVLPAHRVLLSQLYEAGGNIEAARGQLTSLLHQGPNDPANIAVFIKFLLRLKELEEAKTLITRLEHVAPDHAATVALRVEWLKDSKQTDKIEPLVEDWSARQIKTLDAQDQRRQHMINVTGIYAGAEQDNECERWFRRLLKDFPETYPLFANWLVGHNRTSEAISLCLAAWQRGESPEAAIELGSVLLRGTPTDQEAAAVEPQLQRAIKNFADNADVQLVVANIRLKQQDFDEAIVLLERVTQLRPKDVMAWNNLAAVLAERPKSCQRALKCIDEAIRLADRDVPMLLDTKATVLLHLDQVKQAARLLEGVVTSPGGIDPRFYFHLSVAYERTGDLSRMRLALAKARELGLSSTYLTDLEKDQLAILDRRLN